MLIKTVGYIKWVLPAVRVHIEVFQVEAGLSAVG
jgi:hypothetical protein